jgi:hypothetical protein
MKNRSITYYALIDTGENGLFQVFGILNEGKRPISLAEFKLRGVYDQKHIKAIETQTTKSKSSSKDMFTHSLN